MKKFIFTLFVVAGLASAHAIDYRSANRAIRTPILFDEDRTARLALSLGIATNSIKSSEADEIVEAVNENRHVPQSLSNTWQKLLRLAQISTLMVDLDKYFTFGNEFETVYHNHDSLEEGEFEKGAKIFEGLLKQTFGVRASQFHDFSSYFWDGSGRKWKLTYEYVKETADNGGFELVTPPFFKPEETEQLAALMWLLGKHKIGQSNKMTGGHQTYSLFPNGKTADSGQVARVVANMLLLQAQFAPAIFEILDIRRWGGPLNFYMRPILFDHQQMLAELQAINPKDLNLKTIYDLMYIKHLDREVELQARQQLSVQNIDAKELQEILNWPVEKKQKFRQAWKYRDTRVKINLENPMKTLFEVRIGDYVADRPEQSLLETYIYQLLLNKAWDLASKNQIWQLQIPQRVSGESDTDYWQRLRVNPLASRENLLAAMDINDSGRANLILGRAFETFNPKFKAHEQASFGFEIEGYTEDLVNLILPRNPVARAAWSKMSFRAKVNYVAQLGFKFDETYTPKKFRILTTEFMADTDNFPFLSPDLYLEASGNWEVKSSLKGFSKKEDLAHAIHRIAVHIPDDYFGLHIHRFIPDSQIKGMTPQRAGQIVDYFERLSFYMLIKGYSDSYEKQPAHYLDSWSLDRYSLQDLQKVYDFLTGKSKMSSSEQKYHNFGFRPVQGGIDVELRDIGHEVNYGLTLADRIDQLFKDADFTTLDFFTDKPLYFEVQNQSELNLRDAVKSKFTLSPRQEELINQFQFEIYKPSMSDFFYFEGYLSVQEVKPKNMDTRFIHTNFENNLAIPLLNFGDQSYISSADKTKISKARENFNRRVRDLAVKVSVDPKYDFMNGEKDFLHLAAYLKKSTHPTKPNMFKVRGTKERHRQAEALESLVYELRSLVVRFVHETKLDGVIEKSLAPGFKTNKLSCSGLF